MRRRPLFLAAVALPIALGAAALLAPGCGGSGDDLDDICGWLRDPQGCYRTLFDEVRTRCGAEFDDALTSTPEAVKATDPKGRFFDRNALDICVLEDQTTGEVRGQVRFDTAPAIADFPLTTLAVTRLDARSEPCSTITVSNPYNFSLQFHPCSEAATDTAPVCKDSFDGSTSLSGVGKDPNQVTGGSFSVTTEEGRDIYLTSCPDGTQFRFNRFESAKCDGFDQLLPKTEIDSFAGGTAPPWEANVEPYNGWIRLRLTYPPYEGELEGADPTVIQYFNCVVPFQNPCDDGIKNFYETDVDCGGPMPGFSPPNQPNAPPVVRSCLRCATGQICESDSDCDQEQAPTFCVDDPMTGFKRCDDMGASGSGGSGGGGGAGGGP